MATFKGLVMASESSQTVNANLTRFFLPSQSSLANVSATEADVEVIARTNGFNAKTLQCKISANSVSATSTLRFRKNAANGNLSVSITASTTGTFEDTSNSDTVAAGDSFAISIATGATGTSLTFVAILFSTEATNLAITFYSGFDGTSLTNNSATRFSGLVCDNSIPSAEANVQIKMRAAGTLRGLRVRITTNGRSTTSTLTSRVNAADGAQTISITAATTGFLADTTNSDSISADQTADIKLVTSTGGGTLAFDHGTTQFDGSTNSQTTLAAGVTSTAIAMPDTTFAHVAGSPFSFAAETSPPQPSPIAGVWSKLHVNSPVNTVNNTSTFKSRKNGSDGSQACSIPATTTGTFEDTTNSDTIAVDDTIGLATTSAGTGNLTRSFYSSLFTAQINNTETPTVLAATFSIPTYTVIVSPTHTPTVLSATFSIPTYTVDTGGATDNTETPTVLSATFTIPAWSLVVTSNLSPTVLAATFSIPTYTVIVSPTHAPTVLSATFSIPAWSLVVTSNLSPTVLSATFSIPTYSLVVSSNLSPTVLTATFSIPTYTVTIGDTFAATVLVATFSIPTYALVISSSVSPTVLSATFSIPTYTVDLVTSITITPDVLTATFNLISVSVELVTAFVGIKVEINGVDVSKSIQWRMLRVDNVLTNQLDTAYFEVLYETVGNTYQPVNGQIVTVYDDDTVIFEGPIVRVDERPINYKAVIYQVEAADYTRFLDRKLVIDVYENMTVEAIIAEIISTYTTDGFTTTNVECDTLITHIAFNYEPVSDCFKQLAEIAGYDWYVDTNKDIHFFAKETNTAPFEITDAAGVYDKDSLIIRNDNSQVRNQVYVRGGEYLGTRFTASILANGTDVIYPLGYRYSEFGVTLTGQPLNVGVDNLDNPDLFDVLYNYQEKIIRFREGRKPTNTSEIRVHGLPYIPVIVKVSDNDAQQSISTAEGGTGVYEHVIIDKSITTKEAARARASAEIDRYKSTLVEGEFVTKTPGLRAGQLIHIDVDSRDIDQEYIINKVTYQTWTPEEYTYHISLITTKTYNMLDWMQSQIRDSKKEILINPDEVLDVIENAGDEITIVEDISVHPLTQITDEMSFNDTFTAYINSPPTWVAGYYAPTSINDRKRAPLTDRDATLRV